MDTKNDTLGEVAEFLERAAESGTMEKVTADSMRTTLARVFRAAHGGYWKDIKIGKADIDEALEAFWEQSGRRYPERTKRVYRMRIRRALEIYAENRGRGESSSVAEQRELLRKLMTSIETVQAIFEEQMQEEIFRNSAKREYNFYAVPVSGRKIAALALPKDITLKGLKKVDDLLDGIFMCEVAKKGGAM